MIHLDTNFLILSLVPGTPQDLQLRQWIATAEPVALSAIVWTEFLCGPVSPEQIQMASNLFQNPEPYLPEDSRIAADWFNRTGRRRGSLTDCMIAAIAFRRGARLATENQADFRHFIPLGLALYVSA
ncbi:MAG: PIN domain-containing protein [Tepidisphaeraceae bacterium]|jgi:predicted nucleic acid-binding protein